VKSRDNKFCASHQPVVAKPQPAKKVVENLNPGKCMSKTSKGKPCKGKPMPGKTNVLINNLHYEHRIILIMRQLIINFSSSGFQYCINHADKAPPQQKEVEASESLWTEVKRPKREEKIAGTFKILYFYFTWLQCHY
jgi:hypothetical protein